jgi:hypothetical protein
MDEHQNETGLCVKSKTIDQIQSWKSAFVKLFIDQI